MPQYLLIQLPDGKEWEMTAHIARNLFDFIAEEKAKNENLKESDFEKNWLRKLPLEDQRLVRKQI